MRAGRARRSLLGLPSSGLLADFLNTHLAAGEVRGAKSAEPFQLDLQLCLGQTWVGTPVCLVLSPGLGCSIRLEASWSLVLLAFTTPLCVGG